MRGHLHEVATGLAALLTDGQVRGGSLGDLPARLLDVAGHSGETLAGATRAARERLRDLAIRAATALPGSGGESAAGQIAGISGAKAASICAAGAITAGCLAAGVVPGVGGLEVASPKQSPRPPASTRSGESPPVLHSLADGSPFSGSSASRQSSTRTSSEGRTERRTRAARSSSSAARSARPTISGRQTGTEFGAEAAGVGVPAPTFSSGSSGSSGTSSGEGAASRSGSDGSNSGESKSEPEFGL